MAKTAIMVRVDDGLLERIDAEAARRRWSRAAVVLNLLESTLLHVAPAVVVERPALRRDARPWSKGESSR